MKKTKIITAAAGLLIAPFAGVLISAPVHAMPSIPLCPAGLHMGPSGTPLIPGDICVPDAPQAPPSVPLYRPPANIPAMCQKYVGPDATGGDQNMSLKACIANYNNGAR